MTVALYWETAPPHLAPPSSLFNTDDQPSNMDLRQKCIVAMQAAELSVEHSVREREREREREEGEEVTLK